MPKSFKVLTVPAFTRAARKLMSEEEIADFKFYISHYPLVGDVVSGTGRVRKVRWAIGHKGQERWCPDHLCSDY